MIYVAVHYRWGNETKDWLGINMQIQYFMRGIGLCTLILAISACGTPPGAYQSGTGEDTDVLVAEGAASADPTYRVRGANGLLDLGISLF